MFAIDACIDRSLKNEKVLKYNFVSSAVEELPEKASVFEFGCGAGTFIRTLADAYPHLLCRGFDVDIEAIKRAKQQSAPRNLSFDRHMPKTEFDLVFAVDVFEHVDDLSESMANIWKIVKPGGVLLFHMPLEKCGVYRIGWLRRIKDLYSEHQHHYDLPTVLRAARDAGYEIEDVMNHYHLVSGLRDFLKYWMLYRQNVSADDKESFYTAEWQAKIGGALEPVLRWMDVLAYHETKWLQTVEFCSAGVSVHCRKRK